MRLGEIIMTHIENLEDTVALFTETQSALCDATVKNRMAVEAHKDAEVSLRQDAYEQGLVQGSNDKARESWMAAYLAEHVDLYPLRQEALRCWEKLQSAEASARIVDVQQKSQRDILAALRVLADKGI